MRTKSQLNKQAKHTTVYTFEEGISFAEHGKLISESSEFHLTLKRAHRVHFSNSKYAKKAGHFKWKTGNRNGAKKREFTPESGTVDTYAIIAHKCWLEKVNFSRSTDHHHSIA